MRTLVFIAVGLMLAGVVMWASGCGRRTVRTMVYSVGWPAVVVSNLRTGMSHAYALQEELPIQAVIYVVPVAAAWWLARKRLQR